MVRVIMHGCSGKMGHTITELLKSDNEAKLVAGIDRVEDPSLGYPVFTNPEACDVEADVVIDFSAAPAVEALLDFCEKRGLPLVLCTTGLTRYHLDRVQAVSGQVAILKSANMSLGINLLQKLLKEAALKLAPAGYDIEVVEKHHNLKLDSPSGTALALADSVNEALNGEYEYVYDRSGRREKRPKKEIGISAIRGGTIVGDHDVIFAGEDEVITFSHRIYSKAVFAKGAIQAAKFLAGKPAGLYDMSDVIQ